MNAEEAAREIAIARQTLILAERGLKKAEAVLRALCAGSAGAQEQDPQADQSREPASKEPTK